MADFDEVIAFLRRAYPKEWPADEAEALIEEAKEVVRKSPEEGMTYYSAQAKAIRETGGLS